MANTKSNYGPAVEEFFKDTPSNVPVGEAKEIDVVKQPPHYKQGTFEVIDEMLIVFGPQKTFDFCILNAWKYRARAPFKDNMNQDMDKANRYLEMAKQIADAYSGNDGYNFLMPAIHLIKGE